MDASEATGRRYWAFIAYTPDGAPWAEWLFNSLETYGTPKFLAGQPTAVGPVPKRLFPVFLDREELPLGNVTGDPIEWALRESRSLIVICSSEALRSPVVEKQIRYFRELGRENRLICLVVDPSNPPATPAPGPVESLVPEAAKDALIVDVRKGGDSKPAAKLRIIAQIIGVEFAALRQRDQQRTHRRIQMILAATGVVFIAITLLTVQIATERQRANAALQEAVRQQEQSDLLRRKAIGEQRRAREMERRAVEAQPGIKPLPQPSTNGTATADPPKR